MSEGTNSSTTPEARPAIPQETSMRLDQASKTRASQDAGHRFDEGQVPISWGRNTKTEPAAGAENGGGDTARVSLARCNRRRAA